MKTSSHAAILAQSESGVEVLASGQWGRHSSPDAKRSSRIWPLQHSNVQRWAFGVSLALILCCVAYWIRASAFDHSEHVVLRIQGSTSLGDDLVPELAQAFLRDDLNATDTGIRVVSRDSKGHRRLHVWAKVPGRNGLQVIEIYAGGSGTAFKCLAVDGGRDSCDIGMSSRPINDRDRQLYPALRNLGDHATEHVIALDGIAIVVNPSNPVSQLSIPQLRAVYTRQITNWRSVGGNDAPIELFERDRNSGTYEMFTEKVIERDPQAAELDGIPADHQIGDSSLMVESIMHSPNSIGYVSSPMVNTAKALSISDGSGPAIQPTELSIVTEDYPICRRLLLYNWDAPGSLMNAFIRYTVYKPGQLLVEKTPFVELTTKVFNVSPPADSPAVYKRIAADFDRIGLSFHFSTEQTNAGEDPGSQLDNLAEVNVLRLRTFLAQHGGTGNDVLLIGFTDGTEKKEAEESLAHKRAESVATSLRAVGVTIPSENIRDFGAHLPVASNESIEGRRRNRRVEIWVRNTLDHFHGKVESADPHMQLQSFPASSVQ
jgi:phosphate transport system substrate-binding protein